MVSTTKFCKMTMPIAINGSVLVELLQVFFALKIFIDCAMVRVVNSQQRVYLWQKCMRRWHVLIQAPSGHPKKVSDLLPDELSFSDFFAVYAVLLWKDFFSNKIIKKWKSNKKNILNTRACTQARTQIKYILINISHMMIQRWKLFKYIIIKDLLLLLHCCFTSTVNI